LVKVTEELCGELEAELVVGGIVAESPVGGNSLAVCLFKDLLVSVFVASFGESRYRSKQVSSSFASLYGPHLSFSQKLAMIMSD
jgi:hypothetical protein